MTDVNGSGADSRGSFFFFLLRGRELGYRPVASLGKSGPRSNLWKNTSICASFFAVYDLLKKIHMYTGLLTFSALIVFGVAGVHATLRDLSQPDQPKAKIEHVDFVVQGNLTDKQLADRVYETLKPPLAGRLKKRALRHDAQGNLVLPFHTVNGLRRVTVLEKENRLLVATERLSLAKTLNALHATVPRWAAPDLRVRLWAYYMEMAIWSLIGMSLSGVYLWLAVRPGSRWGQVSFGAGSAAFLVLYWLTR